MKPICKATYRNRLIGLISAAAVLAATSAFAADTVNTGNVAPPTGVTDPDTANNESTDTDTITLSSDLVVIKNNDVGGLPVTTVEAGGTTTYTVRVTNNGPSSVTGATFTDPAVSGLTKTAVSCSATVGNACSTAPTVGDIEGAAYVLPTLASGAFYELTITADVDAVDGSVTNAATASVPSGTMDPTPGNNTGSDTDTVNPVADLVMVKSNGLNGVTANQTTTYTLTVTNNGPSPANGAVVTDTIGSNLTCAATNTVTVTVDGTPMTGPFTVADLTGAGITLANLDKDKQATLTFDCSVAASPTP